jgi:hypothetical protein
MFDHVREQVDAIFHDEPEHRIIDVCLTDECGTEADMFVILAQFFCGGLSLRPCDSIESDLRLVASKMRQCGVRCDIERTRDDHFSALASIDFVIGEGAVPVRFPIVRESPACPTFTYFPTDSPGPYVSRPCKYFHIDRDLGGDYSRYFVPIDMQDGSIYAGRAPHCDIPRVACLVHPYTVSSASKYPVLVCRCDGGLQTSSVCVYSGEDVHRVRFVPEINVGFTSGMRRRCPGPRLAW